MKFAILLQHYFPYGGLQRDSLRLAETARRADHEVSLITASWDGPKPIDTEITVLHSGGSSNHAKAHRFSLAAQQMLPDFDTAICFSRVPNSPFHFCGDPCFLSKFRRNKPSIARLLPRYRTLLQIESAIFGPESKTHLFFLSPAGPEEFVKEYNLQKDRYTILPPWLSRPINPTKVDLHREFQIPEDSKIALFVGSNFVHKRLDLAIAATAKAGIHLLVCGDDQPPSRGNNQHVRFAGPRDDIPRIMRGADLLLHPSKHETAGMILTEALVHHLPVICTETCGYAPHVHDAGSLVISSNPEISEISHAIEKILANQEKYRSSAAAWAGVDSRYETAQLMLNRMADHPNPATPRPIADKDPATPPQ